jgi:hypothetical protein
VKGMNRDLAPGVSLIASLDEVQDVSVRARRDAILLRANAAGDIRLDIDRPVTLKRPSALRRPPPAP